MIRLPLVYNEDVMNFSKTDASEKEVKNQNKQHWDKTKKVGIIDIDNLQGFNLLSIISNNSFIIHLVHSEKKR